MRQLDPSHEVVLGVSDFVALTNQTLEYAYPSVTILGELANFRVSKNKWVYFDLKDEMATVRFFGTVYQINMPLEDGMTLRVRGTPRLHALYGFSVTVLSLKPEGEGTIRRAAALLHAKLEAEGLFDLARKRTIPYPPVYLGLITSAESAAFADFMKVLNERWRGIGIECADVQVQGEVAPDQIVKAIGYFNEKATPPDVLVITRGGGSSEDLSAFNTEVVARAVAASRVPTLVAIGHEVDISLAELAADRRASTPSNAAELLVPDREDVRRRLNEASLRLLQLTRATLRNQAQSLGRYSGDLNSAINLTITRGRDQLKTAEQLLDAFDPRAVVRRGYAIVRSNGKLIRRTTDTHSGGIVDVEISDGHFEATVQ